MSVFDSPAAHAEAIFEAFGGRRTTDGYMVRCPAHDDRTPSLHVTVGERVLIHCQAGCEQWDVISQLRARRLWPEPPGSAPVPTPATPKLPRYWYETIEGARVYKERHDTIKEGKPDKYCIWYRENGAKGIRGLHPKLYGTERLEAGPKDAVVYFVEGEKCVHALWDVGLLSVCAPNGSNTWAEHMADQLSGHRVVILPDNDEPGKKHARQVLRSLRSKAEWSAIVELAGLGLKEDVADWLGRGGSKDEIERIVQAEIEKDKPHPVLVLLRDVERRETRFGWHPYFPVGNLVMADGDPGVGKSTALSAVAAGYTNAWALPNDVRRDQQPQKVLILAGEESLEEVLRPRLEAMGANLDMVMAMVGVIKGNEEEMLLLDADGLVALEEAIRTWQPGLVIVDPVVAFLGGKLDMGKANEVRAILRPLGDMAQRYSCTVVATRHLTKAVTGNPIYRGQGSIDFNATARSVLGFARDPSEREVVVMTHIKSSLARPGPSQTYTILDAPDGGVTVGWGDESALTADDLFGAIDPSIMSALDEAREFLREVLYEGSVSSKEVSRLANSLGITDATVRRARRELGVKWVREGQTGKRGGGEIMLTLPLKDDANGAGLTRSLVNNSLNSVKGLSKLINGGGEPENESEPPENGLTRSYQEFEQVNQEPTPWWADEDGKEPLF